MIIRQKFIRGKEIECGEEFFEALPADEELQTAMGTVLDMLKDTIAQSGYAKHFIIEVDTDKKTVDVVEVA